MSPFRAGTPEISALPGWAEGLGHSWVEVGVGSQHCSGVPATCKASALIPEVHSGASSCLHPPNWNNLGVHKERVRAFPTLVSDAPSIEGEYVPVEGDEVTYKMCPIPPKNQKFQAVEVVLTQLVPHTPHETWSGQVVGS